MPDTASTATQDSSLARRSMRGAAWTYGGAAFVIVGQLAYTALTARLISPAEFGAYATAQALLLLVGYFTLGTVGNAVIRHPTLDRQVVGSGVILTIAAGTAVAAVILVAAGYWAEIWRSPEAASLIRLFAPQVLFTAIAIVPLGLLRRGLRYRAASLIETSSVLVGFVIGALLALKLRTAEALVLGQVANAGALVAMSIVAVRSQLSLSWSVRDARALFSFSSQVSLQNLGHYLNNTLPSFVVSRSLGQTNLGFYSRASLLVGLPLTFLAHGVDKTLYPIYPRFREREEECRRMMLDVASVATTLVWPLFAALAGLGPLVVEVLLGARWAPVAPLVGPVCLYAAMNFAYTVFTSFAESLGYLRQIWLVQTCWTVALIGALAVAVRGDADVRAIVLAAAAIQLAVHGLQIVLLHRVKTVDAIGTVRAEVWAAGLATVWYVVTALSTHALSGSAMSVRIVASCALVVLLSVATWLALPHLPAGRAFSRRGIRITWQLKAS